MGLTTKDVATNDEDLKEYKAHIDLFQERLQDLELEIASTIKFILQGKGPYYHYNKSTYHI